jgi:hypothetical protein
MMYKWNFHCTCALCLVETRVSDSVLAKRDDLPRDAAAFMKCSSPYKGTTELMILQAEKFAREIFATYDNKLYSNLPRTALVKIQAWLLDATSTCRNVEKSKRSLPNLLRSLGYEVYVRNGSVESISPTAHSILPNSASVLLGALVEQFLAHRVAGRTQAATDLIEFAKSLGCILHGLDADTVRGYDGHLNTTAGTGMAVIISEMTDTSI